MVSFPRAPGSCAPATGGASYAIIVTGELNRSVACRRQSVAASVFGDAPLMQERPEFRDHILFHEYFDGGSGCGLGASHQTGWTGLVALLLHPRSREDARNLETGKVNMHDFGGQLEFAIPASRVRAHVPKGPPDERRKNCHNRIAYCAPITVKRRGDAFPAIPCSASDGRCSGPTTCLFRRRETARMARQASVSNGKSSQESAP